MKPLAGIRVLDLTRILAGPFATMKLADMGADVVKVENPKGGDDTRGWGPPFAHGESAYFLAVNRGKRSLAVDLKDPRGMEAVKRLASRSDVVVSNFRPGTMDRLGLGWAEVHGLNPRAIWCSISGYGESGPGHDRPSYDVIVQGESGAMSLTGEPDGRPTKFGLSIADLYAGTLAVEGILLAIIARGKTGEGQRVEVALMDGMLALLAYQGQGFLATGEEPVRHGNAHPSIVPYETFRTADGFVNLGVGSESLWAAFCRVVGREDLAVDPRFRTNADRVAGRAALVPVLSDIFRARPTAHWMDLLGRAGIPCGRVRTVGEVLGDPARRARGMVVDVDHPRAGRIPLVGVPVRLSATPGGVTTPPPLLGQHTDEVMAELGYEEDQVAALRQGGVIA